MNTAEGKANALLPLPRPELRAEELHRRRAHLEAFATSLGVDATIATAVVDGLMNRRQEILNRVAHLPADGGSLELWSLDDQKFLNHLGGSLNASVWPNIPGFQIGAVVLLTLGNGSEAEYLARME